jgi:hypothetical protein
MLRCLYDDAITGAVDGELSRLNADVLGTNGAAT